jgi:hypothetical protein
MVKDFTMQNVDSKRRKTAVESFDEISFTVSFVALLRYWT